MRKLWILLLSILGLAALVAFAPASARADSAFPSIINLPTGWQPEGIASGRGTTFYVGSLAGRGIYRGDLRTGQGASLTGPVGGPITGVYVDQRTNYVFAAGAGSGVAYVFDGDSGALLQTYSLAPAAPTFINDGVVTRDAAYFTNSQRGEYYRLPLGAGGALPDPSQVQTIPLSGDFAQVAGFNSNGIEASPDGKWLLIVQSATGKLFRVDPTTGVAALVDLGGYVLTNGDGLRLRGQTLYVVQNRLNQIAVFDLAPDYLSGEFQGTITHPAFNVPTTVAAFGSWLYAVNAKFGIANPATQPFEAVQVSAHP